MTRIIFFIFSMLLFAGKGFAQQPAPPVAAKDTVLVPANIPAGAMATLAADTTPFITPKKIALFSAIVPGLGQYHNKQYWKIGVIYAGVGVATYFLQDNIRNYNKYRRILADRANRGGITGDDEAPLLSDNSVGLARDYYKKNLDLTVLLTAVGYTLQIVDAVVFAHLKGFDISEDISINARPVLTPQGGLGFGLVMKF